MLFVAGMGDEMFQTEDTISLLEQEFDRGKFGVVFFFFCLLIRLSP